MEHTKTIRQCFLVESFTGFGNFIKQHKYLLLPYLAITTGMRAGEFKTAEPVIIHNRLYLQINGSKSENAVRRVPITQKVADAYSEYKKMVLQKQHGKSLCICPGHYSDIIKTT